MALQTHSGSCHCGRVRFEITTDLSRGLDPLQFMVNARCVDAIDVGALRIEKFDGRSWETRPDAPYTGIW